MKRTTIAQLYQTPNNYKDIDITVCGWVRSLRDSKSLGFIDLNDGSCFKGVQVVFEETILSNYKEIAKQNVGTALCVTGTFVLTPDAKQPFELHAKQIHVEGASSPEYPLQKKRHSLEYLRTIAHLRPRTNTYSAAFRVRSAASFAIHQFFQTRGFLYAHTPIITGSDCEGAGEMFRVTTLRIRATSRNRTGKHRLYTRRFPKTNIIDGIGPVGRRVYGNGVCRLAISIHLVLRFRAEHSNTQRHAAEFWMIEPEIAFADLQDVMLLAQDLIKFIILFCHGNLSR